jgi:hypothetical protein
MRFNILIDTKDRIAASWMDTYGFEADASRGWWTRAEIWFNGLFEIVVADEEKTSPKFDKSRGSSFKLDLQCIHGRDFENPNLALPHSCSNHV